MKILTIGLSPFLVTSRSQIHSWILQYLYFSGHEMKAMAWGHDTTYFIPDENEKFFFDFKYEDKKHKIPLVPFHRGSEEAIAVYEVIDQCKPDLVITIGDIEEFLFMRAVKSFCTTPVKWLTIITSYSQPINENNSEILEDADAVLCTSQFCFKEVSKFYTKDLIETQYVGSNHRFFYPSNDTKRDKFRIMACGKSVLSDNLPMIMEVSSRLRAQIPDLELYLHANSHDVEEYDLSLLKDRFDPKDEYIVFPDRYISLLEGLPIDEFANEFRKSSVFVSVPLAAGTSMSIFESIACGCLPIMSNCGSNVELAVAIEKHSKGKIKRNDILVPGITFMTTGETYLSICDPAMLEEKILNVYKKSQRNKGIMNGLSEFTQNYGHDNFMKKVCDMVMSTYESNTTICLETI